MALAPSADNGMTFDSILRREHLAQGEHSDKDMLSHFAGGSMTLKKALDEEILPRGESQVRAVAEGHRPPNSHFESGSSMSVAAQADDGTAFDSLLRLARKQQERVLAERKRAEAFGLDDALIEGSAESERAADGSQMSRVKAAQRLAQKRVRLAGMRRGSTHGGGVAAALLGHSSSVTAGCACDHPGRCMATSPASRQPQTTADIRRTSYASSGVARAMTHCAADIATPGRQTPRRKGKRIVRSATAATTHGDQRSSEGGRAAAEAAMAATNWETGQMVRKGRRKGMKGGAEAPPTENAGSHLLRL